LVVVLVSRTSTVKVVVPTSFGVPEIPPVALFSFRPLGSFDLETNFQV
jgi:hypothetical protein